MPSDITGTGMEPVDFPDDGFDAPVLVPADVDPFE